MITRNRIAPIAVLLAILLAGFVVISRNMEQSAKSAVPIARDAVTTADKANTTAEKAIAVAKQALDERDYWKAQAMKKCDAR